MACLGKYTFAIGKTSNGYLHSLFPSSRFSWSLFLILGAIPLPFPTDGNDTCSACNRSVFPLTGATVLENTSSVAGPSGTSFERDCSYESIITFEDFSIDLSFLSSGTRILLPSDLLSVLPGTKIFNGRDEQLYQHFFFK